MAAAGLRGSIFAAGAEPEAPPITEIRDLQGAGELSLSRLQGPAVNAPFRSCRPPPASVLTWAIAYPLPSSSCDMESLPLSCVQT